ncbi:MAG: hypothetical protein MJZ68_05435 [archaeon]|nr:hypothetical protein [archaeon]
MAISNEILEKASAAIDNKDAGAVYSMIETVPESDWVSGFLKGCAYSIENNIVDSIAPFVEACNGMEPGDLPAVYPIILKAFEGAFLDGIGKCNVDFTVITPLVLKLNDLFPEDDEVEEHFITDVFDFTFKNLNSMTEEQKLGVFKRCLVLAVVAFKIYVETSIVLGFFDRVKKLADEIKMVGEPGTIANVEKFYPFVPLVTTTFDNLLASKSEEELDDIENYWVERNVDIYAGHVINSFNMFLNTLTAGKITAAVSRKVMNTEIELAAKVYIMKKGGR